MEGLINGNLNELSLVPAISLWDLVLSLCLSAVLCTFIAQTYIWSHSGHSYSRSFVHTLIFVGVTVSLVMLIIGSNIARAFALVGALSIIRFRNPVKDSRDVAFIFISMAIGMACGTRFYLYAVIFALFMAFLVAVAHYTQFGRSGVGFYVLRVRMRSGERGNMEAVLEDACRTFSVVSIDRLPGDGTADDFVYEVNLKRGVAYEDLVDRISRVNDDISVALLVGDASVNV